MKEKTNVMDYFNDITNAALEEGADPNYLIEEIRRTAQEKEDKIKAENEKAKTAARMRFFEAFVNYVMDTGHEKVAEQIKKDGESFCKMLEKEIDPFIDLIDKGEHKIAKFSNDDVDLLLGLFGL